MTTRRASLPTTSEILIDLARCAREGTAAEVLDAVADAVRRGSGFKQVAINVYVPAFDEYWIQVIKGSPEAEAALAGARIPAEQLDRLVVDVPERVPGAFFLPAEEQEWDDSDVFYIPELVPLDAEDAWLPEDALLLTLRDSADLPLGFLSVDEPVTGLRPTDEELRLLRAIAAHAEQALETAQRNEERDLAQQLGQAVLELATQLPHMASMAEVEEAVGDVLASQFGFERAASYMRTDDRRIRRQRDRGWTDEELVTFLPELLDPAVVDSALAPGRFEDGCWLVPAIDIFPHHSPAPRSRRNGRGPHGWNDHCLVVPARSEGDVLISFLVLEDPTNRALPSAEHRRAVRVLAELSSSAKSAIEQRERLAHLATHDPLTGLRNRRGLDELISEHREVAVLVCDVDHFKAINDRYGHDTGDRVLTCVGDLLLSLARDTDVAIRMGGEEFAMVLPQTDRDGALGAAERLRVAVQERLTEIVPEGVTVSIGIAATSDGLIDAKDLLSAADRSMYAAKQSGRNRIGD